MNPKPTSIIAFRNGSIGNTLVAVPALRAIKSKYPSAKFTVIVDLIGYELLEHCPWIDELIIYDKKEKDKGIIQFLRLAVKLRSLKPTHAILFKRFFRNGLLAFLSGSKTRIGFRTNNKAPFLNLTVDYDETVNIIELNLKLAKLIDAESEDTSLDFFFSNNGVETANELLYKLGVTSGSYAVVHYGGHTTDSTFFPKKEFSEFLISLLKKDCRIIFIGSGNSEFTNAQELCKLTHNSFQFVNQPIRVTAALIKSAKMFIGFNSGPAHIASAVKTPGLVLFKQDSKTDLELKKWAPPVNYLKSLIVPADLSHGKIKTFSDQAQQTLQSVLAFENK